MGEAASMLTEREAPSKRGGITTEICGKNQMEVEKAMAEFTKELSIWGN